MKQKKETNIEKTRKRLDVVQRTLLVFERFFTLGYNEKSIIKTLLLIHFPEYNNTNDLDYFTQLWLFKNYKLDILQSLELLINKIDK